jgi:hypothetical protein
LPHHGSKRATCSDLVADAIAGLLIRSIREGKFSVADPLRQLV